MIVQPNRITEEVAAGIWRIPVPLPENPLRELNSYVLTGGDKPVLVDLGFDRAECCEALENGLAELGLGFDDIDVLITHGHPDHCGDIARVWRPGMRVYAGFESFSEIQDYFCQEYLAFKHWLADSHTSLHYRCTLKTYSRIERDAIFDEMRSAGLGELITPTVDVQTVLLKDGDSVELGGRTMRVIEVKGHCPNHICLLDENDGVLIAGDQVLPHITPNLAEFTIGQDVLAHYIASFEKLYGLDVSIVLPAHRHVYTDLGERIGQLREHHVIRTEEVRAAVARGCTTVVDVARAVTWKSRIPNWDDWPNKQKFFAIGETLAHLSNLESNGFVDVRIDSGNVRFYLA